MKTGFTWVELLIKIYNDLVINNLTEMEVI